MGKLLTKSDILRAQDIQTVTLPVPEWGGDVMLRGLTGRERDLFEESILDQRGKQTRIKLRNARARLVSLSLVDEQGNRIFSEAEVEALGEKSAKALDRVYSEAAKLSGISDDDMEELVKNAS